MVFLSLGAYVPRQRTRSRPPSKRGAVRSPDPCKAFHCRSGWLLPAQRFWGVRPLLSNGPGQSGQEPQKHWDDPRFTAREMDPRARPPPHPPQAASAESPIRNSVPSNGAGSEKRSGPIPHFPMPQVSPSLSVLNQQLSSHPLSPFPHHLPTARGGLPKQQVKNVSLLTREISRCCIRRPW